MKHMLLAERSVEAVAGALECRGYMVQAIMESD